MRSRPARSPSCRTRPRRAPAAPRPSHSAQRRCDSNCRIANHRRSTSHNRCLCTRPPRRRSSARMPTRRSRFDRGAGGIAPTGPTTACRRTATLCEARTRLRERLATEDGPCRRSVHQAFLSVMA
jgi:hypothetical protein